MAHVHNTFPLISPSILAACAEGDVPVVATLHNFRLMCANGLLLRGNSPCEKCVTGSPFNGVRHRCYRGSAAASLPIALGISVHRRRGTWMDGVARFLTPSDFVRGRYIAAGFPEDRLRVKRHFVPRPRAPQRTSGGHALFLGRLTPDKGLDLVLQAWSPEFGKLVVVGDGPERQRLEKLAHGLGQSVEFMGKQPRQTCMEILGRSRFLVVASTWYETFGLVVAEAFAHGVPVVAPDLGVFPELVVTGRTGLLFAPGDVRSLREALRAMADPKALQDMGRRARTTYERELSPEVGVRALTDVYEEVAGGGVPGRRPRD